MLSFTFFSFPVYSHSSFKYLSLVSVSVSVITIFRWYIYSIYFLVKIFDGIHVCFPVPFILFEVTIGSSNVLYKFFHFIIFYLFIIFFKSKTETWNLFHSSFPVLIVRKYMKMTNHMAAIIDTFKMVDPWIFPRIQFEILKKEKGKKHFSFGSIPAEGSIDPFILFYSSCKIWVVDIFKGTEHLSLLSVGIFAPHLPSHRRIVLIF